MAAIGSARPGFPPPGEELYELLPALGRDVRDEDLPADMMRLLDRITDIPITDVSGPPRGGGQADGGRVDGGQEG